MQHHRKCRYTLGAHENNHNQEISLAQEVPSTSSACGCLSNVSRKAKESTNIRLLQVKSLDVVATLSVLRYNECGQRFDLERVFMGGSMRVMDKSTSTVPHHL